MSGSGSYSAPYLVAPSAHLAPTSRGADCTPAQARNTLTGTAPLPLSVNVDVKPADNNDKIRCSNQNTTIEANDAAAQIMTHAAVHLVLPTFGAPLPGSLARSSFSSMRAAFATRR
jgi:hypothetical protein